MKAFFVLDEMPLDCWECCMRGEDCETEQQICLCAWHPKSVWKYMDGERPDWCPLRPMPERKEVELSDLDYTRMMKQGWNACLDEMERSRKKKND